jgi:hypothetical protein
VELWKGSGSGGEGRVADCEGVELCLCGTGSLTDQLPFPQTI